MNISDYQAQCLRTTTHLTTEQMLEECLLSIPEEAGEILRPFKKHRFHGMPLDKDEIAEEIGDVMWYCVVLAHCLGIDASQVLDMNLRKLQARYPDGFVLRGNDASKSGKQTEE